MTPTTQCYINEYENSGVIWSNEPPGQSGFVPLSTVYNIEPVPTGLSAAYTNYILGAQGNSWAEYIPSFRNMGFKAYPRLCAIAELDWMPAAMKNFEKNVNNSFYKIRGDMTRSDREFDKLSKDWDRHVNRMNKSTDSWASNMRRRLSPERSLASFECSIQHPRGPSSAASKEIRRRQSPSRKEQTFGSCSIPRRML